MYDLTIIIPARNEMFLDRTIQDALEHIEGKTEIIAILDGYIPDPPLTSNDPRLTIIYNPIAVGQRAASNQAARLSKSKYLMKVDAHCAFDQGFDVKMMSVMQDNFTLIPTMKNLHVFDWVCPDGHRRYQGKSGPCEECGKPTTRDIVWRTKNNPTSITYRFDKTLHFQYYGDYAKKQIRGSIVGWILSFDITSIPNGVIDLLANLARSHGFAGRGHSLWFRENVAPDAMGLSFVDNGGRTTVEKIFVIGNKSKMGGITTAPVLTKMINDENVFASSFWDIGNKPSIGDTVCQCLLPEIGTSSVPSLIDSSHPVPTTGDVITTDLVEKFNRILGGNFSYSEKTSLFHNGSVTLSPIYDKDLVETMSIQGSCFMCTREKWFDLDICSEEFHSWGQQGVEIACKTWLSGGRVVCTRKTWYSHMFRTKGGDFGFPYVNPESKIQENRELSRRLFQGDQWPKAIKKFQWLIDKFNPPDWEISKGAIYYTDSELDEKVAKPVRDQLEKISKEKNIPITSSSLKGMKFGVKNIRFPSLKRSFPTMFKQILGALENTTADIIFFTEHDVLYHPSHFDFVPPDKETFYYNQNVWMLRTTDGHALHYDVNQLSGLCVYRQAALTHFRERYERFQKEEFTRNTGFEPFTHNRVQWPTTFKSGTWKSELPNVDIKHGKNPTGQRWNKEDYRNQQLLVNWTESEDWSIPGWSRESLIALR